MEKTPLTKKISKSWDSMGVWLICILLFAFMSVATDSFFDTGNFINLIRQVAVTGIVALGATFVVMSGEIDLSQGGFVCLFGCLCAYFIRNLDMNYLVAIGLSIVIGAVGMSLIGLVVAYLHVPSFIATLGSMHILSGLVLMLTNSQPITNLPGEFNAIARGYIFGNTIPIVIIILLVVFAIGAFVLRYLPFGRKVIIVGENPQTATLSGISVPVTKVIAFAIAGACSALGGVVLASRLGSGQPSSGGDVSLLALASVFVGGASKGSVSNTLAGTLIIGMISNGLNLMGVSPAWKEIILGAIIIAAVVLDIFRSRNAAKK
jgi:ribose/xylose/arabinose/galactoside ABC-type transport system permease subunit